MRLAVIAGLVVFVVLVFAGSLLIVWNWRLQNRKPPPKPVPLTELKPIPRIDVLV